MNYLNYIIAAYGFTVLSLLLVYWVSRLRLNRLQKRLKHYHEYDASA